VCHRQLKHRGLLALFQKGQQNDLTIREFQRVMMCAPVVFVDLSEDCSLVAN
jgi:hypothetical protein